MGYPRPYLSKRRLLSYAIVALVMGGVLGGVLWNIGGVYFPKPSLGRFSSYQELVAFLKREPEAPRSLFERLRSGFTIIWGFSIRGSFSTYASETASGEAPEFSANIQFSATNIQVAGVDEADIVKTDGRYLYLVSGSALYILRAYPPEEAEVLSRLELSGAIAGIFVNDDKLVVFQEDSGLYSPGGSYRIYAPFSILVYDLSDRSRPLLERNVTIDGYYFNSRMIGDYVYVVVNKPARLINDSVVSLPVFYSDGNKREVEATSIYYINLTDYCYSFTSIIAVNVQDSLEEPTVETFLLGCTSCLYVSRENLYLVSPSRQTSATSIYKLRIEGRNIDWVANGTVPGYVLNQFSMDEHDGYFRIATTTGHVARRQGEASSKNHVYVLDGELNIVGKLEDLAPGERIHSARFMGDRCYLVTFRKVDPLFVIDLEDPENPRVLGKLKIPGYSDYLHPYDETHLIGVGKETVPAEEGDFSWYQGVKISLFDVSNVSSPREVSKVVIGDRGTDTPVLRDHKAFLFSRSKHLLVLPILLAEIDPEKYSGEIPPYAQGDYVFQGAYIFNITLDEGLVLRGRITHLENNTDLLKSGYYFSSPYSVKRALYIGNILYTISDRMVKMNSLEDLKEIGAVELP
ncbi:hypothetical protein CW700_04215 [Candidatus Bathyarchaeota archaeon]|nr:MAG: hypothetical protein CW700_04215 [Candidatus Bathyarchaeota archaeon]